MRAHATKLIIFAKIAYGLIVPTLLAAGMARVSMRRWFPVVLVVETLWSIFLVWVGYHLTAFISTFEQTLHAIGFAILAAIGIFVLFRLLRKRIDQQELELDPLAQGAAHSAEVVQATKIDVAAPGKDPGKDPGKETTVTNGLPEKYEGQADIQRCVALPEREKAP
jgi:hypothetical protein